MAHPKADRTRGGSMRRLHAISCRNAAFREVMSREKGNSDVSESQVKENLNGTTGANGTNGFAIPGVFGALAEQGVARAQEGCVRIKLASEQMAEALREAYSANAGSAT